MKIGFISAQIEEGALVCLPTVVVTAGRCECCDKFAGIAITLDWLFWSVGVEIHFGGWHS